MGSFEVAVAALRQKEPRVHIVFKRDQVSRFEQLRSALRRRLGVIEAPIDQGGVGMWVGLRDALRRDEIVVLQGDRVMPGQKGQRVPFLSGHLLLPTGPVKLAQASGAPIVPIFSTRTPEGNIRISVAEPIFVEDEAAAFPPTGGRRGLTRPSFAWQASWSNTCKSIPNNGSSYSRRGARTPRRWPWKWHGRPAHDWRRFTPRFPRLEAVKIMGGKPMPLPRPPLWDRVPPPELLDTPLSPRIFLTNPSNGGSSGSDESNGGRFRRAIRAPFRRAGITAITVRGDRSGYGS